MKNNKSLNEAIFRAQPSTKKNNQSQDHLYHMAKPENTTGSSNINQQQVPLNESHKNLMQSWMNLRSMDSALAEKLGRSNTK